MHLDDELVPAAEIGREIVEHVDVANPVRDILEHGGERARILSEVRRTVPPEPPERLDAEDAFIAVIDRAEHCHDRHLAHHSCSINQATHRLTVTGRSRGPAAGAPVQIDSSRTRRR